MPSGTNLSKNMEKGFWAVPRPIAKRKNLSLKAKLIAGVLWSLKDSKSEAFPSRVYVADVLGVSTKTVDRGIEELKEKARLKAGRRGFGRSNCYSIPDWLSEMATPEGAGMTNLAETGLTDMMGSGVTTIIDNVNKYTIVDDKTSSSVKEIFRYFKERVRQVKGFDPEISWAKEGRLLKLRLRKYRPDQVKELIDWYLASSFSEKLGVSLATCLSTYIINLWKQVKASQPYYWKPPEPNRS